jgi:hypothetical protein
MVRVIEQPCLALFSFFVSNMAIFSVFVGTMVRAVKRVKGYQKIAMDLGVRVSHISSRLFSAKEN